LEGRNVGMFFSPIPMTTGQKKSERNSILKPCNISTLQHFNLSALQHFNKSIYNFLNELNMGFATFILRLEKSMLAFNSKPINKIRLFKYSQSINMIKAPSEP
jgi:hypothetical protein